MQPLCFIITVIQRWVIILFLLYVIIIQCHQSKETESWFSGLDFATIVETDDAS